MSLKQLLATIMIALQFGTGVQSKFIQVPIDGIENEQGVLAFKSQDYFLKTTSALEDSFNQWFAAVQPAPLENDPVEKNPSDFDYIWTGPYFVQDPLDDFEDRLKFSSLRRQLKKEEQAFLRSNPDDISKSPDDHFIPGPALRTVFNSFNEVKVGDVYYRLGEESYETFNDIDSLIKSRFAAGRRLAQSDNSFANFGNRRLQTNRCCSVCRRKNGTVYSGKRIIKWTVGHWAFPCWLNLSLKWVYASTASYYKLLWFTIPFPVWTTASVYGAVSGNSVINCIDVGKVCLTKVAIPTGSSTFIFYALNLKFVSGPSLPGWVSGYHKGAISVTYTSNV